ncbi:Protein of unknown function [Pseudidiomarina maritima]|uniref:Uncharacterized protein n=1 Tax=Pseudidiomarina maritima TaxID=519453 RepID=A0A1I6H864_9GAMM|nr:DUF3010 family protein [Pseudidiomarina maritima]SFR50622.1 Protein of unknown function [Pseudidiomarina maritima]
MRSLGIELSGSELIYVLVDISDDVRIVAKNKLELAHTRDRNALVAFQTALRAVYNELAPEIIGIKEKPEKGKLSAGASALKMEGIALASSPCNVRFVSGTKVNKCKAQSDDLKKYQLPAYKVAVLSAEMAND